MDSQPTLATYEGKITPYGLERCYEMGIQIIEMRRRRFAAIKS